MEINPDRKEDDMIKPGNSKISSRIASFVLAGAVITFVVVGLIPARVEGMKISEKPKRQVLAEHEARIGNLEKSLKAMKNTVMSFRSTAAKSDARMRWLEKRLGDLTKRLNKVEMHLDSGKESRRDKYAK